MNVPRSEWKILAYSYVQGQCTAEEAAYWEHLMLSDDEALRIYMQAMAEMDGELPSLPDPEDFARRVLAHEEVVPYRKRNESLFSGRPRRWYERPIFHYTVAASITLVFVFSGAFDRMFPVDGHRDRAATQPPSYSEQLMEKTTGWLDRLKPR